MTVSSAVNRNDYAGNGSTTSFAVSFRFLQNSDVKATLRDALSTETLQVETTDYTLTGAGGAGGGTLVMIVAPPSGTTLTIQRDVPATQETDYVENDEFPAEAHEDALDKLTMLVQQQGEDSNRHIGFSDTVSDATGQAVELSQDATQRADKLLGFDSAGNIVTKTASSVSLVDQDQQDKRYGTIFATVASMTAANPVSIDAGVVNLTIGMTIQTQGYTTPGDGGGVSYLIVASQAADGLGDHVLDNGNVAVLQESGIINILTYGAVRDGVTNDAPSIRAALATLTECYAPAGVYSIETELYVHPGCAFRGAGSGMYEITDTDEDESTVFQVKSNTASVAIRVASKGIVSDLMARPENHAAVTFDAADYPAGTGNAGTGIILGDSTIHGGSSSSAKALNVTAWAFSIQGFLAQTTTRMDSCHAFKCEKGYVLQGADGWMTSCVAMFNHSAGVECLANYWRYGDCRFEWNARYGVIAAGESTFTGNLFDRNGWAGIALASGSWGQVITGNYFSRNGCGGDGSKGRWDFSVPGHPSYVVTASKLSCHIQIDFQRAVTITGNRYRFGGDDASGGSFAPAYIYSSNDVPGATPRSQLYVESNAGEFGTDGLGYNAALYGATGALAGGTDTTMSAALLNFFARSTDLQISGTFAATERKNAQTAKTQSASLTIDVPTNTSGRVLLRSAAFNRNGLASIYFSTYEGDGTTGLTSGHTNHLDTTVSGTAFANVDADTNRITITIAGSFFNIWSVEYLDVL